MRSEITLIVQLAVGLTFGIGAAGKLLEPKAFIDGLLDYKVVPSLLITPIGIVLILLEALIAIAHLTGWMIENFGVATLGLLGIFLIATANAVRRHEVVRCLCFGGGGSELVSMHAVMRIALLIAAESFLLIGGYVSWQWSGGELVGAIAPFLCAVLVIISTSWILSAHEIFELIGLDLSAGAKFRRSAGQL